MHQSRIFEQFHHVDSSNTKTKGSTDLGLATPSKSSRCTVAGIGWYAMGKCATESPAQNKKLTLKTEVAKSLPVGLGD